MRFFSFFSDKNEKISIGRYLRLTVVSAMLGVSLGLSSCKEETRSEAAPRPVKTIVAVLSDPVRKLTYSGSVRARVESSLGFRVQGKLVERLVNTGDKVGEGQVLARIDPIDLKLSEAAQAANVEAAKTRLQVAKAALARAEKLLKSGYASQAAYDNAKLEADAAQGALDAAEAQLRQSRNQVGYADLTAPANGIITAVNAEPGQVVSAGQSIFTMAESKEVEVALALPENELKNVAVGLPAQITLWADERVIATGKIREISGAADSATRTYAVRVSVDTVPPDMRLGMTATVSFTIPAKPEIRVPLAAVTHDNGKHIVWIADPQSETVSPREIQVSELADDGVRVAEGVKEGDIVVTAGLQFLTPGQKVKLEDYRSELARAGQENTAGTRERH